MPAVFVKNISITFFVVVFSLLFLSQGNGQAVSLHGTVYDYFSKKPLDAVSVFTTTGKFAITDSLGKYVIPVTDKDSVWFSYLSKNTQKYPVDTISNYMNFEVALYVDVAWLPEVKVFGRDYRLDSIQNRDNYAKIFNYRKPTFKTTQSNPSNYVPGSVTAGLDIVELINMFRFKRNRQLQSFQDRLLQQEQDKYVDHRFSKLFVRQLTGLEAPELDTFMIICRPEYYTILYMNDLELGYFIQECYRNYLRIKKEGRISELIENY